MQPLRNAHRLARFVLVWFALSIGVAIASPMVHPKALELVCSGSGGAKLVAAGEGTDSANGHTLDCPLCMPLSAPPPQAALPIAHPVPLAHVLPAPVAAHIAAATAPPLPSRGPPVFFL